MVQEVKFSRVTDADREYANYLRKLADRIENGEVYDCVVVFQDREGPGCERSSNFNDRWRLLGALEYAKDAVHQAD